MKKILVFLLLLSSLKVAAQSTVYVPEVANKLNQKGLSMGPSATVSTANWTSSVYNELYAPLSLPANNVYILRLHIAKANQETTTQLYYVGIQQMQNGNASPAVLTPFLVFQTSGTSNSALQARYRKPQNAYQVGTYGIEATVLSSAYEGGTLTYSLTPFLVP